MILTSHFFYFETDKQISVSGQENSTELLFVVFFLYIFSNEVFSSSYLPIKQEHPHLPMTSKINRILSLWLTCLPCLVKG